MDLGSNSRKGGIYVYVYVKKDAGMGRFELVVKGKFSSVRVDTGGYDSKLSNCIHLC